MVGVGKGVAVAPMGAVAVRFGVAIGTGGVVSDVGKVVSGVKLGSGDGASVGSSVGKGWVSRSVYGFSSTATTVGMGTFGFFVLPPQAASKLRLTTKAKTN